MKPSAWTLEEKNKFLTLLMGKCWHEIRHILDAGKPAIAVDGTEYICGICKERYISRPKKRIHPNYYLNLSGFQIVKEWAEKEMPEVWNDYLKFYLMFGRVFLAFESSFEKHWYTKRLNHVLSLDNFISFLLQNTEAWAYKECWQVNGWSCNRTDACVCTSNGEGGEGSKIKSPALLFAEGLK